MARLEARDFAHWLSIRYGVSWWKADRWIHAANALHGLPGIAAALEAGTLGIDKVVELSRFATPDTEGELVAWACESTCATIRRRADLEVKAAHTRRRWSSSGTARCAIGTRTGRRFGLEARMPSAQGAIVAKALQRVVDQVPVMPAELDAAYIDARRADALLALRSQRIAVDADADRATVVVHARSRRSPGAATPRPSTARSCRRRRCSAWPAMPVSRWSPRTRPVMPSRWAARAASRPRR